ncbi:hypothetical protein [Streptomyces sp. NPDC005898]|uniref:hypothetical protein n=1 Tax=Streptomyces sp. NPDC005898 TaxID=3157082 RepID=UPI0033D7CCC8
MSTTPAPQHTAPQHDDAQEPPTLSPADLHRLAEAIATELGPWEPVADRGDCLHLAGPDQRAIGLRLLFSGRALQTFAIGGTPPDTTPEDGVLPLAQGVRYSTGVTFTCDETPLEATLHAVRAVLLPAFEGHRPLLTSRGSRPPQPPASAAANSAPAESAPPPQAPKARTRKSTVKPKADPKPRTRKAASKPKETKPRRTSSKTITS